MLIIAIPLLLSQFQHSFNSNNDSAAYCLCIQSNDHVFSSLYSYMNKIAFFMNINSKTTTLMLCAYFGLDNNWESFVAADITKRSEIKNPWSWYQHTCGSDMRQSTCGRANWLTSLCKCKLTPHTIYFHFLYSEFSPIPILCNCIYARVVGVFAPRFYNLPRNVVMWTFLCILSINILE